ncbi:MAG: hypothetical protein H6736_05105 [Alphaproteobacteria bacterium]|nr:hypothetical protein [Alphaproteobacteria bacterium]MCB9691175.1 hypothetical protein [Alphaproteobacteria bacterium]
MLLTLLSTASAGTDTSSTSPRAYAYAVGTLCYVTVNFEHAEDLTVPVSYPAVSADCETPARVVQHFNTQVSGCEYVARVHEWHVDIRPGTATEAGCSFRPSAIDEPLGVTGEEGLGDAWTALGIRPGGGFLMPNLNAPLRPAVSLVPSDSTLDLLEGEAPIRRDGLQRRWNAIHSEGDAKRAPFIWVFTMPIATDGFPGPFRPETQWWSASFKVRVRPATPREAREAVRLVHRLASGALTHEKYYRAATRAARAREIVPVRPVGLQEAPTPVHRLHTPEEKAEIAALNEALASGLITPEDYPTRFLAIHHIVIIESPPADARAAVPRYGTSRPP